MGGQPGAVLGGVDGGRRTVRVSSGCRSCSVRQRRFPAASFRSADSGVVGRVVVLVPAPTAIGVAGEPAISPVPTAIAAVSVARTTRRRSGTPYAL
ncbi:hypothetical protein [Streptomyces sp. APSN-46.1]|uniref:hypothetical protein n=1 Tax=Streptomyces sp. APSN-46.1 TaxID=2929049 RepID=UPI0035ABD375